MNRREKEVIQLQLKAEEDVLAELAKQYKAALNQINEKIRILQSDELTQSKVYQIQYQKALRGQIEGILEKLHGDQYSTIQEYLKSCYTDSFVGTMYSIHGQGIPVMIPIDQNAAVKAIQVDSKISNGLYTSLGVDTRNLKKAIREEVTRGISTGMMYGDIARNIENVTKAPLSRANTIVRTEGHRIQQQSAADAREAAKSRGADVVKHWDATLDGATRPKHRKLDGQIREVDEPFEADGKEAMYPGDFGDPAEDCNCRCVALTRARWALDEEELETLKARAEYFELDKAADFEDFREKYLDTTENPSYTILEKLHYSGMVTPEIEADVEASLSLIPERHRILAESQISGIHVTDSTVGSGYHPKTKAIYYSPDPDNPHTIIHEYAHGLEVALNIYEDPKFLAVRTKGLEDITAKDVIYDESSFTAPIYRVESPKFISVYQGRLYEKYGIYSGRDISFDGMLEYFSEGYREYIVNPSNLKKHDPDLFAYIEGIT